MFTPYYILAVGFGVFAVVVSLVGIKRPNDFPGKFTSLVVVIGVLFAVATFAMVWKGGEEEVDHREHEEAAKALEASGSSEMPAGVKPSAH
ncbi:MAG: hypothetical protein ACSLFF_06900 [Solirubrobacterales bacterium]